MSATKEDVIDFISNMSVLELSVLIKELEEKFGVLPVESEVFQQTKKKKK